MTSESWTKLLIQFDENLTSVQSMPPAPPAPHAVWNRESAHRTVGHLATCQAAWLPLLGQISNDAEQGFIAIRPDPLYRKMGYITAPWEVLVERFAADRIEWRRILTEVDLEHVIQTPYRRLTAQTLTKRMVDHERRHLEALEEWGGKVDSKPQLI